MVFEPLPRGIFRICDRLKKNYMKKAKKKHITLRIKYTIQTKSLQPYYPIQFFTYSLGEMPTYFLKVLEKSYIEEYPRERATLEIFP